MDKYAVCIIKDNDISIISTHSNLDDALENGNIVNKQLQKESGTVGCLSGAIKDNRFANNKTKIHKIWI